MAHKLKVVDVETTGMEPPAEVCEIGWCGVTFVGGEWMADATYASRLCGVNAMPPEVRAVHHIAMEDVKGCPPFSVDDDEFEWDEILVAHNADFERRWMRNVDRLWICTYKCALRVWPNAPDHKNGTLRYWLEDQGLLRLDHEKAMPPHRAGPDAYVTAHILLALLRVATVEQLIEWSGQPRLLPKMPLGKWKGYTWDKIDWSYLDWIVRKSDLDDDMKWNARRELDRRVSAVAEPPY